MSRQRLAWWVMVVVGVGGVVVQLVFDPMRGFPFHLAGWGSLVVGAVLAWRVPSNPISWLLFLWGVVVGVAGSLWLLLERGPLQPWAETIYSVLATSSVLLLPIVLVRFPHGRLGSRWSRGLQWLIVGTGVLGASAALLTGGWGGSLGEMQGPSPLYESTAPLGENIGRVFFPLYGLSMSLAALSLIARYRRTRGEERLQFKWLAFAAAILIVAFVAFGASSGLAPGLPDLWVQVLLTAGLIGIPVSIGVAVLRYRLYDLDLVISRTLVLAILAGFITIIYAAIVVGLGQLIGGNSDQFLLPILATALVAIAFEPARHRAERWANRLVFGDRATPYEVLSDLTERLSGAEESGGILGRMAELLREGTGADRATVWLGDRDAMEAAATAPLDADPSATADVDGEMSYAVTHDGQVVGALEVVKPRGTQLSSAERSLIADLAGSAGAVLGYQRLNDSLARRATELEESRTRLLGVQDEERRRLEQDLHEGAEQFIVALKVKMGVASQLAARAGNEKLEALLADLTDEAQAALDDVQSLAKGIYPPVLESEGLEAAVSALASSTPVDVEFERHGIGRYSADVEAAVYFDISEAVTNAVKHAEPPIRIEMSEKDGLLRFVVVDSGPGFDLDVDDPGSGLENMADRMEAIGGELVVRSSVGVATSVSGSIPVMDRGGSK